MKNGYGLRSMLKKIGEHVRDMDAKAFLSKIWRLAGRDLCKMSGVVVFVPCWKEDLLIPEKKVTLQIRRMDEVVLNAVEAEIVWSYGENFGCRFLFENRYAESSIERFLSEIVGGELLGRRAENT